MPTNVKLLSCNCSKVTLIPSPRHTHSLELHVPTPTLTGHVEYKPIALLSGSVRSPAYMWLLLDVWVLQLHVYPHPQSTPQSHTCAWDVGSCMSHPKLTVLQMDAGCLWLPAGRMCHQAQAVVGCLTWLNCCSVPAQGSSPWSQLLLYFFTRWLLLFSKASL